MPLGWMPPETSLAAEKKGHGKGRVGFFFVKKKQKTFICLGSSPPNARDPD
jgi:hypothetical protein